MVQQRLVQDLLKTTHLPALQLSCPLRTVAQLLLSSESEILPVADEWGRLTGVISESSVVRLLMTNPPVETTIAGITSRHVESVRRDAPLTSVLHLFRSACHTALPVVDHENRVCGMLLRRDVMLAMLCGRIDGPAGTLPKNNAPSPNGTVVGELSPHFQQQSDSSLPAESVDTLSLNDSIRTPADPPRPHFLRGEEARRKLFARE